MARARRPLGNRAGHPVRRTWPAHAAEAAAVGAGRADRWRARAAAIAAVAGHATASTAGRNGARRRRCDGAGACVDAANDASQSWATRARGLGQQGGSGGGIRQREWPRTRLRTHANTSLTDRRKDGGLAGDHLLGSGAAGDGGRLGRVRAARCAA